MTSPVWMALPPEVHSALLSSGPGPGSLLAAAGAWNSLSAEYASVAEELTALVNAVQAGVWEGPSAARYAAANMPYVAWLLQQSANSAETATQQEIAATAHASALAAMPTLFELAANHAIHAALVATNFFGINTIPVALNEADYVRMWVQAATTMSTYQAVSSLAVAAAPQATPAPQIVNFDATSNPAASSYPTQLQVDENEFVDQLIAQYLGFTHTGTLPTPINPFTATYPTVSESQALTSIESNYSVFVVNGGALTPGEPLPFDLGDALFFINYTVVDLLPGDISEILHGNLSQIFSLETVAIAFSFISMRIGNILEIANVVANIPLVLSGAAPVLTAPLATLASLPPLSAVPVALAPLVAAPVAAVGGFTGLAGLAGLGGGVPPAPAPPPAPAAAAPAPAAPPPAPAVAAPAPGAPPLPVGTPPPLVTGASMGAGAGIGAHAGVGAGVGMEGYPYLVGGIPAAVRSSTRSKVQEPASDEAPVPVAAAAPATEESPSLRRRPRKKVKMLGRGHEYMDLEPEPDAAPSGYEQDTAAVPSVRGAGPLGFAGTAPKGGAGQPAGLATLADDAFGGGPRMPMMPGSWGVDPEPPNDPDEGGDGT
jgi:PPE-repeat protein